MGRTFFIDGQTFQEGQKIVARKCTGKMEFVAGKLQGYRDGVMRLKIKGGGTIKLHVNEVFAVIPAPR